MAQAAPTGTRVGFLAVLRFGAAMVGLVVLFLVANYALNAALATVDKAPIRENLRLAFENRQLDIIGSRGRDADLGVHQTNDCLIYDMAARDYTGDPLYLLAGGRTGAERSDKPGNCTLLRDWLNQREGDHYWQVWYLRYVHGYRAVAIGLLSVMSVEDARSAMKTASYAAFAAAVLLNLGFAVAAWRRGFGFTRSRFLGYALAVAAMMPFFGLPYFGQSISHAPAIVTMGLFVVAWTTLDAAGRLSGRAALIAIVVFALFTGYFEFLTGYIPVGVCLIAALVAIGFGRRTDWTVARLFWFLVACEAAFAGTFVLLFGIHTVVTAVVDGTGFEVVNLFLDRLGSRMAQTTPAGDAVVAVRQLTLVDVAAALNKQLGNLGPLAPQTAAIALLALAGVALLAAYDAVVAKAHPVHRFAALMAGGAFLPVVVWILLFQNHTTIHAAFMVRILVAVPLAAAAGAWCWYRATSEAVPVRRSETVRDASRGDPKPLAS